MLDSTPRRLKVGVQIRPNHAEWSDIKEAWMQCDQLKVDSIWTFDHFFPIDGDLQGSNFECWTLLSAMSQHINHAQIGTLVSCYSYRNSNLLADMSRTMNHATNGSFILGIGAGWLDRDYEEYGFVKEDAATRIREMENAIVTIRKRFKKLNPQPISEIPILIGGLGKKLTLPVVARQADMWNGWGSPDEFLSLNRVLDNYCRDIGRDPNEIERTIALFEFENENVYEKYLEAGATHLIIVRSGPSYNFEGLEALIAWRDKRNEIGWLNGD
tara:strand:+ start:3920 stop:4732 length:813 start_codon:yes stop_codon:yes gene_type:complete